MQKKLDIQCDMEEKKVEVPVEKVIRNVENSKKFGVIAIIAEGITGILFPIIIGLVTGSTMVSVHLCVVLSAVTIIGYTIALSVLEKKKGGGE